MWSPQYLVIKNIQTHSDTTFRFAKGRVIMIKGVNNHDHEPKSNGSGKSSIIEGISIAYTGDFIRKITTPDMIKDGCHSAYVELLQSNSATGETMQICRTIHRPRGKRASLDIYMNGGSNPEKFASIDDGNDFILEKIGISKVDLYNYYIVSKKKYKSFYYSGDADKRALISRFSNADILEVINASIKEDVSLIEGETSVISENLNILSGQLMAYESQISNFNDNAKDVVINGLKSRIDMKNLDNESIKESILLAKKRMESIKSDIEVLLMDRNKAETELNSAKVKDFSVEKELIVKEMNGIVNAFEGLDNDISDANQIKIDLEKRLHYANKDLSSAEKSLMDVVECPECSAKFSFKDNSFDVAKAISDRNDALKLIESINEDIDSTVKILSELKESANERDNKLSAMRSKKNNLEEEELKSVKLLNSMKVRVMDLDMKIKVFESKLGEGESYVSSKMSSIKLNDEFISAMELEIETAKNRNDSDLKNDLLSKVKEISSDIDLLSDKIADNRKGAASYSKWIELFKRFNVKLSNMAIKSIEGLSNDILVSMGSNLSVAMDGYKVNRDGTVSDSITASVLRDGNYEGVFFRLSEGEQARINYCTILAMQQLINMSCKGGGLDMLFTDEITESLDSAGIKNLVQALDVLGRTMVVITHASDEEVSINNVVTVVKEATGSTIFYN